MTGHHAHGLLGHQLPGRAGIGAAKEAAVLVGDTGVDGRRGLALGSARLVVKDDGDAGSVATVRGRKAANFVPACARVRALPQPVLARPEVENTGQIGIDGEPFAVRSAILVAAHLDGHVGLLPGVAAIA